MRLTEAYFEILKMKHRIKVVQGSKGAGKTYAILTKWILRACIATKPALCTIVSDSVPSLEGGAVKDFEDICIENGISYRGTKRPYIFYIGVYKFEFLSIDKEAKARGRRRDYLFINEADRISWRIARHLIGYTNKEVFIDFNPVQEFWAHHQYVNVGACDFLKLTYKNNQYLPDAQREAIERHAPWGDVPDENYWRVYGLGEIGFLEGIVFKNYQKFEEYPEGNYLESIGVDFGDTDPMAATYVRHYPKRRELYFKELFYASEADIEDMAPVLLPYHCRVYCDHNPKLIRSLRKLGVKGFRAIKKYGLISDIQSLKQNKIFISSDSKMLNQEFDNYTYQRKGDFFTNYPDQSCEEHGIDAGRYGAIPLL